MPRFSALPSELVVGILECVGAAEVCQVEIASKELGAIARERDVPLWRILLRAKWPCEGHALASLASSRRVYKAFLQKRPARTNIRHLHTPDDAAPQGQPRLVDEARVAFVMRVGDAAGVAAWRRGPDVHYDGDRSRGTKPLGLRWWPEYPDSGTFDVELIDNSADPDQRSFNSHMYRGYDALEQSLYAIDTREFECVTIFHNVKPITLRRLWSTGFDPENGSGSGSDSESDAGFEEEDLLGELDDENWMTRYLVRHNYLARGYPVISEMDGFYTKFGLGNFSFNGNYPGLELYSFEPFSVFRSENWDDEELYLKEMRVAFHFHGNGGDGEPVPYMVFEPARVREFVVDLIRQTHHRDLHPGE
mmetsp:Transcript_27976/g.86826  ORF Transcript_27976/g.86826 Transcript_27976/m.86826 type:complete len:363 (-) Transcript_27976:47-1135(-)